MANVIKHKRGSGSDPAANNLVIGELAIRTDTGKLFTKMDSGAIAEIAGGGSDIAINTLSSSSGTGGGSATFNGSAYRFTLSAPPSVSAAQLLVSINGVIQKPVTGTGQPSEGFAVDGTDIILGDAPATGSDFFILTFKSLGVSEPADNSVTSAKIVDGAIVNADINASAAIAGTKINPDFGSQNIVTTGSIVGVLPLAGGTLVGNLAITREQPIISFNDTTDNPDYYIGNIDGSFRIRDTTNSANRLIIDSSGRLLLGTTTEGYTSADDLTVATTGHTGITIRSGTTSLGTLAFSDGTSGSAEFDGYIQYDQDNRHMDFATGGGNIRTRILSNGDIGINTTTINRRDAGRNTIQFDYSGSDASEGLEIRLSNSAINGNAATDNCGITYIGQNFAINNNENGNIQILNNGAERMRIDSSGRVGIGTTSPDDRLVLSGSTGDGLKLIDGTHTVVFRTVSGGGILKTASNHALVLGTNDTERMRIDTSGNLTFSMEAASGYPTQQIKWSNDSTTANGFYIAQHSDRNGRIWHEQGLDLVFGTNNTERMRIDSVGALNINTSTNPLPNNSAGRVHITCPNGGDGINVKHLHSGHCVNLWRANGDGTLVNFYRGDSAQGSTVGGISVNSSNTAFNTASDYRLKENATAISDGITRLKKLKPYRFNFKIEPSRTVDGFFAHEVTPAVPEAITGEKDALDSNGDIDPQSIDQSKLVPLLVAALQEAIGRIEALEAS